MSNFIPSETKRFVPSDPPWITNPLKTLLNKKNRLFKNYKKHGYKEEVNKPGTKNFHWKIINRVMNRCRAPKIPPFYKGSVCFGL